MSRLFSGVDDEPRRTQLANVGQRGAVSGEGMIECGERTDLGARRVWRGRAVSAAETGSDVWKIIISNKMTFILRFVSIA